MSESPLFPVAPPDAEPAQQEQTVSTRGDLHAVLIHNDDVTPFDYVIGILGDLFMLSGELAEHVAWTAHSKGTAVVVVRPRTEAEKLVKVARGRARVDSYPLTFTLEQD